MAESTSSDPPAKTPQEETPPILSEPRDGVPDVVETSTALAEAVSVLAAATGPVAVDTERAQGFRYTGRAYLLQLRRSGTPITLIDPLPFADDGGLGALRDALWEAEWILHAASQDLPSLAELDLVPQRLFDTELAARLLGYPRVALGTLLEDKLGVRLLKEHSAADWSRRPLPTEWLAYAALDVELLIELRDILDAELVAAGKDQWAAQEFEHLLTLARQPVVPRTDPWRRTSGVHKVRTPIGLAVVRELWTARDDIARRTDSAPGRILGDEGISMLAIALAKPTGPVTASMLRAIPRFNRREARAYQSVWIEAAQRAISLPRGDLPPMHLKSDAPPPPRSWANRDPAAAARWETVRPLVTDRAEQLDLPVENLIGPDPLRRVLWAPAGTDADSIDSQLTSLGVRPWQRQQVVDLIVSGLAD